MSLMQLRIPESEKRKVRRLVDPGQLIAKIRDESLKRGRAEIVSLTPRKTGRLAESWKIRRRGNRTRRSGVVTSDHPAHAVLERGDTIRAKRATFMLANPAPGVFRSVRSVTMPRLLFVERAAVQLDRMVPRIAEKAVRDATRGR